MPLLSGINEWLYKLIARNRWHFPGDPVVKTSPSNAGVVGQSLIWELRSHMPHVKKKYIYIKQKQYCNKFKKDFKSSPKKRKKKWAASQSIGNLGNYGACM